MQRNWPWYLLALIVLSDAAGFVISLYRFDSLTKWPWATTITAALLIAIGFQCILQQRWRRSISPEHISAHPLQSKTQWFYWLGLLALYFAVGMGWLAASFPGEAHWITIRIGVATLMAYRFLRFARVQALSQRLTDAVSLSASPETTLLDPSEGNFAQQVSTSTLIVLVFILMVVGGICVWLVLGSQNVGTPEVVVAITIVLILVLISCLWWKRK